TARGKGKAGDVGRRAGAGAEENGSRVGDDLGRRLRGRDLVRGGRGGGGRRRPRGTPSRGRGGRPGGTGGSGQDRGRRDGRLRRGEEDRRRVAGAARPVPRL